MAKETTTKTTPRKTPAKRTPSNETEDALGSTEAKPKLTDKQRLFVEFYMGQARWNATEAARLAGYSDPEVSGWENKQKPAIQKAISRRIETVAMGADEVLLRLAEPARASFKPFLVEGSTGELWPDLTTEAAQANLHLLKKIKPKKRVGGPVEDQWVETEVELELHDAQAALVHLGRHHKLFTDKQELAAPDGGPVLTVTINGIPASPHTGDGVSNPSD